MNADQTTKRERGPPRFRKERLAALIASAKNIPGARVAVDLTTGQAFIEFLGNSASPQVMTVEAAEADDIEKKIKAAMGGKKK